MRWFTRSGLRVLMYHHVAPAAGDGLTVTPRQLAAQLDWLRAEGFGFVSLADVLGAVRGAAALPRRGVLVTFDDAYQSTHDVAFPVLQQAGVAAVVFAPTAHLGGTSAWEAAPQPLMSAAQLRALEAAGWEIALHSHRHENYATLGAAQIRADLQAAGEVLRRECRRPMPALAYPYGRRPVTGAGRRALHEALAAAGVELAFRIGNRVNRLPLRDRYDINRIGPRGDRDLGFFQRQVRWGRWF